MTDKDPTKPRSTSPDITSSREVEDSRKFTYDPTTISTLTEGKINSIYEQAFDLPDASDTDRMEFIYNQLADAGVDLSQVEQGALVVHYLDPEDGTDDVRAIDIRSHNSFGTRVAGAELTAVHAVQAEPVHHEEAGNHERSNTLLSTLEEKTDVLAETLREQAEESARDAHMIDRFLDMVDGLVARLKEGGSVSVETLGRLINEAEAARVITNREEVLARDAKLELLQLHEAVETVKSMRSTEGVVMSSRVTSSSEALAMSSANNESVTGDIKRRITDIVRTLDEFQYSRGHGREEYIHRLHVNLYNVRPALSHHRALDSMVVSEHNGLPELRRLLHDEIL